MNILQRIIAPFAVRTPGSKGFPGEVSNRGEAAPLGAYTDAFTQWVPRQASPRLYEALREAIPPIDAAIDRYVTLDGIVRVVGDESRPGDAIDRSEASKALVAEIEAWANTVRVNDMQKGLQAFYSVQGNELYEQGFVIGEFVLSEALDDVVQLVVADSKGVYFKRGADKQLEVWYREPARSRPRADGLADIERILRNGYATDDAVAATLTREGYRKLDRQTLTYDGFRVEGNNPYGTSLLRPMPFVAQILLKMDTALGHTWARFGDPMYHLAYKTAGRGVDQAELEKRQSKLAEKLASMINMRRGGNSADFVTAVGKDDDVTIKVIGADGQVLEIEMPARHVLEQIVSKTGIPSWLLGFHWSTAERLAAKQCEMMLQESKTRWVMRKPNLVQIVETMLRARGRTWKAGDWDLVQELPNVSDLVAIEQAAFLRAQTELMRSNAGMVDASGGDASLTEDDGADKRFQPALLTAAGAVVLPTDPGYPMLRRSARRTPRRQLRAGHPHRHKESFVEEDEQLPKLERRLEESLVASWRSLYAKLCAALGLPEAKGAKEDLPPFQFDAGEMLPELNDILEQWIAETGGPDSDMAGMTTEAWARGVLNAAAELEQDSASVTDAVRSRAQEAMRNNALRLVKDASIRAVKDDVVQLLASGEFDGMSPKDVARALRARFGAHEYNWRRMARTEIAGAQVRGKLAQYAELEITQYDWVSAPDACTICLTLAEAGPYPVGAGPLAPDDSHPECRCSVTAVVE